ncbi:OmpA family protein [Massilia sp. Dwa41.01b]|uniref:flagellar motor protein MotB n=1 Tax=unclassified Massilia TaxID=2609279 RepID=UPI0016048BD3|nr:MULTISPECIES: flagellar motor protein MotB [unclassified Massilia]QNA88205.1 OmpA family protein [Massilia sp. Dwa41.01b]QNA99107.1 OmpA family protein [Massilia sp. Se16.2.3]
MSKLNDKHHGETIVKRGGGKHDHDEHGGAWKVAFADFCLALLSLFLVLWLMAAREKEAVQAMMRDAAAGQLEGPGKRPEISSNPSGSLIERFPTMHDGSGPGKEAGEAGADGAARVSYDSPSDLKALSKKLEKMSEEAGLASNLETTVTPFGLRVMLHDTDKQGMFMRGSALPTGRFARLLQQMGPLFAQMENQMLVVGHTDSVQYMFAQKTGMSNWTLSTNRAMAARAQLLTGGMRPDSVLQVVGMADRAPLDSEHTDADVNRRIELMILTRKQSRTVAGMFGAPGATEELVDGVSVSAPGKDANERDAATLRGQLAK